MSYEEVAREALERAEKATEGEWERNGTSVDSVYFNPLSEEEETHEIAEWVSASNGDFIAHAHQDVPDLARAVLELVRDIEEHKTLIAGMQAGADSLRRERDTVRDREIAKVLEQKETIEKKDAVIKALEARKDPDNPLIPWDQAKAELRIQEQQAEIEELREEVRLADEDARRGREAYADSLRDWAEGGRVWKLQQEIERLQGLLEMAEFRADSVHKNWNVE